MIALLLAALPFIIQAAPVISAIAGVTGLIADLEAIAASPETPMIEHKIEALFKKHGVDPEQLADAIKGLSWGGHVTKEWALDKRHQLDKDGNFM